jgi:DNA-binding transcriptional regulator YiaG
MARGARRAAVEESELAAMLATTFRMTGAPGTAPVRPRLLLPQLVKDYKAGRASPLMIVQADARAIWSHHWHLRYGGADPIPAVRQLTLEVLARMAKDVEMTPALAADATAPPTSFGARLVAARKAAVWVHPTGMTQAELALKIKTSVTTIRDWESGRHEPQEIRVPRLLRALRCSRSDLFGTEP